ncbi:MAG: efflux RND transporter permease subunit, partial [Proteobacteria bacterium]|nr:efflux RND transporter permease subunit [Pseudomonadota bacterium]
WPGFVGQFMKYMPITLLAVLSASIAMALVFVPVIAGFLKPPKNLHKEGAFSENSGFMQFYKKVLDWALASPKRTIKIAIAVLVVVKLVHSFFGKGVEFFPDVEPDQVMVYVHGRGNLSLAEQENFVTQVEQKLVDMREIKAMHSTIGKSDSSKGIPIPQDAIGVLYIEFVDWQERRTVKEILPEIEKRTSGVGGVWVEVVKQKPGPPSAKAINIEISALDPTVLNEAFLKLKAHMQNHPKLIALEDNLSLPGIEWKLTIDRSLAQTLNADILSIGNTIKMLTNGAIIGTYRPDDVKDEMDVVLLFPKAYRNFDQLKILKVPTRTGFVPISTVASIKPYQKQGVIEKVDGYKVQKLLTNVIPGVLVDDVVKELQQWVKRNTLKGAQISFKGEDKEQKESGIFLMNAFAIALFLVAVILVTQFNSYFSMGVVLSAVVMSTVGVFVGVLVHDLAFGIVMGGIGVIALAGIIVSNNIILIDTYNHLVKEHLPSTIEDFAKIIKETCLQRVRPVILTKLTTILGLIPIMFGMNIDFFKLSITFGAPSNQWWILLATCIVYGVLFASTLTLLVTPAALLWNEQRKIKKQSKNDSVTN